MGREESKALKRVEIKLTNKNTSFIKTRIIGIKKTYRGLFPEFKKAFTLVTDDMGNIETNAGLCKSGNSCGLEIREGMSKWYQAHRDLKVGDTLIITEIERMKKYRLEIVK